MRAVAAAGVRRVRRQRFCGVSARTPKRVHHLLRLVVRRRRIITRLAHAPSYPAHMPVCHFFLFLRRQDWVAVASTSRTHSGWPGQPCQPLRASMMSARYHCSCTTHVCTRANRYSPSQRGPSHHHQPCAATAENTAATSARTVSASPSLASVSVGAWSGVAAGAAAAGSAAAVGSSATSASATAGGSEATANATPSYHVTSPGYFWEAHHGAHPTENSNQVSSPPQSRAVLSS
jgi:hypothetical protein